MESFLPSEIARLVLGYLEDHKCEEAYETFLRTSPHLEECLKMREEGRKFRTHLMGLGLLDILYEYSAVFSLIQERLKKVDPETASSLKSSGSLLDKITFLLNATGSGQTMLFSITLPPGKSPSTVAHVRKRLRTASSSDKRKDLRKRARAHIEQFSPIIELDENILKSSTLETTSLSSLPGNANISLDPSDQLTGTPKRKAHPLNSTRRSRANSAMPEEPEENLDITALTKALLDNHELHEKIAEKINKVISTPELGAGTSVSQPQDLCSAQNSLLDTNLTFPNNFTFELDNAIKKIVQETESDPVFENFLQDVCPADESSDDGDDRGISDTSTPCQSTPETVKKLSLKHRLRSSKKRNDSPTSSDLNTPTKIEHQNLAAIESIISMQAEPKDKVPEPSTSGLQKKTSKENEKKPIPQIKIDDTNAQPLTVQTNMVETIQNNMVFTEPLGFQPVQDRLVILTSKITSTGSQILTVQPAQLQTNSQDILSMPTVIINDEKNLGNAYVVPHKTFPTLESTVTIDQPKPSKSQTPILPHPLITTHMATIPTEPVTYTLNVPLVSPSEIPILNLNPKQNPVVKADESSNPNPSTSKEPVARSVPMICLSSEKKEENTEKSVTPEKCVNKVQQLPLSSPRTSRSHIRALDFSTPLNDVSPKLSISTPKTVRKVRKTPRQSRSLFTSPLNVPIATRSPHSKLQGDWDGTDIIFVGKSTRKSRSSESMNLEAVENVKEAKKPADKSKKVLSTNPESNKPLIMDIEEEPTVLSARSKVFNSWDQDLRLHIETKPMNNTKKKAYVKKNVIKKRSKAEQKVEVEDEKKTVNNTEDDGCSIEAELAKMESDSSSLGSSKENDEIQKETGKKTRQTSKKAKEIEKKAKETENKLIKDKPTKVTRRRKTQTKSVVQETETVVIVVPPESKKEDPPTKKEESSAKNEEPSTKKEELTTEKEEPTTKKGEPTTKKVEPPSNKEEPTTKKEETPDKLDISEDKESSPRNMSPRVKSKCNSGNSSKKSPPVEDDKQKSSEEKQKSSEDNKQRSSEDKQRSSEDKQRSSEDKQKSSEDKQRSPEDNKEISSKDNKQISSEDNKQSSPEDKNKSSEDNTKETTSITVYSPSKMATNSVNKRIFVKDKSEVKESQTITKPSEPLTSDTKSGQSIITPDLKQSSCSTAGAAARNITPMLETPMKNDSLICPVTPGILTPFGTDASFTSLLKQNCTNLDFSSIMTPNFPLTPSFPLTPGLGTGDSQSSYASRPTDYSNSSSYYQPSDSEQNQKIDQVLIEEAIKMETSSLKKHIYTSTPDKEILQNKELSVPPTDTMPDSAGESTKSSNSIVKEPIDKKSSNSIVKESNDTMNSSTNSSSDANQSNENSIETNSTVIHVVPNLRRGGKHMAMLKQLLQPVESNSDSEQSESAEDERKAAIKKRIASKSRERSKKNDNIVTKETTIQTEIIVSKETTIKSDKNVTEETVIQPDKNVTKETVVQSDKNVTKETVVQPHKNVTKESVVQPDKNVTKETVVQSDKNVTKETVVQSDKNVTKETLVQPDKNVTKETLVQPDKNVTKETVIQLNKNVTKERVVQPDKNVTKETVVQPDKNVTKETVVQLHKNVTKETTVQQETKIMKHVEQPEKTEQSRKTKGIVAKKTLNSKVTKAHCALLEALEMKRRRIIEELKSVNSKPSSKPKAVRKPRMLTTPNAEHVPQTLQTPKVERVPRTSQKAKTERVPRSRKKDVEVSTRVTRSKSVTRKKEESPKEDSKKPEKPTDKRSQPTKAKSTTIKKHASIEDVAARLRKDKDKTDVPEKDKIIYTYKEKEILKLEDKKLKALILSPSTSCESPDSSFFRDKITPTVTDDEEIPRLHISSDEETSDNLDLVKQLKERGIHLVPKITPEKEPIKDEDNPNVINTQYLDLDVSDTDLEASCDLEDSIPKSTIEKKIEIKSDVYLEESKKIDVSKILSQTVTDTIIGKDDKKIMLAKDKMELENVRTENIVTEDKEITKENEETKQIEKNEKVIKKSETPEEIIEKSAEVIEEKKEIDKIKDKTEKTKKIEMPKEMQTKETAKNKINPDESELDEVLFHVKIINENSPEFIEIVHDDSKIITKTIKDYNLEVLDKTISAKVFIEELSVEQDRVLSITPFMDLMENPVKIPKIILTPLNVMYDETVDESSVDKTNAKQKNKNRSKSPSNSQRLAAKKVKIDNQTDKKEKAKPDLISSKSSKKTISLEQYKNKQNIKNTELEEKVINKINDDSDDKKLNSEEDSLMMFAVTGNEKDSIKESAALNSNTKKRKAEPSSSSSKSTAEKRAKPNDTHALLKNVDVDQFLSEIYGPSKRGC